MSARRLLRAFAALLLMVAGLAVIASPAGAAGTLTIGDAATVEGTGGSTNLVFTVTASASESNPVTVDFETVAGSASSPGDYTSTTGQLVIPANATSATISVPITTDSLAEPNETFTVVLTNPSTGTAIGDSSATGTITNDDGPVPAFSVADTSIPEGEVATTLTFTATLSAAVNQVTTVAYATSNGTASASDYTATAGTLTFAANETSKEVLVTVTGDTLDEVDETVILTLSAPTNASVGDATATGTILDNDAAPAISVDDPSVGEGSGSLPFLVTLDAASGKTVTVDFATSNGSATAPADYTAAAGTVTFVPGDTSETVNVTIASDALPEANETVTLTLSGANNATIADGTGTGTIVDDEATPTLSIADLSVPEGNAGATQAVVAVTLSTASAQTVTVDVASSDGTATAPGDYTTVGTTQLSFAPGETSKTVNVTVNGDLVDEPNETLLLTLSNAANASIGDDEATVTITDDDATPTVSIADLSAPEGNAGTSQAELSITLSAPSGQAVTVAATTMDGTATGGVDYAPQVATVVTIPAGQTTASLPIGIFGDIVDEADETVIVNLGAPTNATIADGQATLTITDDDAGATISISDEAALEGSGLGATQLTFSVTLSVASAQTVTVDYATVNGTAAAPGDFGAASGTLTFTPGDTSESIAVNVVRDATAEPNETFTVVLSNPSNATTSDVGTGTINNDDGPPPTISVGDVTVDEDDDATITVTASAASSQDITVAVSTSAGTATSPADFTAVTSAPVTIPAGQLTGTTVVPITDDNLDEPSETFTVTLANALNATIADGTATVTIVDNEGTPILSVADTFVVEDNGPANVVITLSSPSASNVTFHVQTANGTAMTNLVPLLGDYTAVPDTIVTIPAGQTSAQVPVSITDDILTEGDETFLFTLSNATGATFDGGDSQATVTIVDDEQPPVVSIADATVAESADNVVLTLTRTGSTGGAVTVDVNTANGTATSPADYDAIVGGTATFAAGSSTTTVTVGINEDALDEVDETFQVALSNATGGATFTGGDSLAQVTITDNDALPSLAIAGPTPTVEGDSGSTNAPFTITLSAPSGKPVTVRVILTDVTTNASDRGALDTIVTFVPGDTSEIVNAAIIGDTKPEANERYFLGLTVASNATISDSVANAIIADDDGGGTYTPVGPTRIVDTRRALGRPGTSKVPANQNVEFDVTGVGGVPATGVASVVLNVTITQPATGGFARVTPSGSMSTSNVNFATGETVANLVVVPVGANGNVRYASSTATHVVMDVAGWFAADSSTTPGSHLTNVTPARVLDTRNGTGGPTGKIPAGTNRVLDVTGVGGVPASNVRAVILNLTVTGPTASTFLSVTPNGGSSTSNVNFSAGETAAGLVIVPVGPDGSVRVRVNAGQAHVIADVFGWFSMPGLVTGSVLGPLTPADPARLLDTRNGTGTGGATSKVGPGETRAVQITGRAGIPAGSASVVFNATVTGPTLSSYLSITPNGGAATSNLNFVARQTVANLTIVPLSASGAIRVRNQSGQTHVVGDAFAYFTAPAT